jgi:flagellar basal body-associated protein FliL
MENENKKDAFLKGIGWILLLVILFIFLIPLCFPQKFCFNSIEYATYVGGLAGPLAAIVGFIYIYLTFLGQQRQLDEQRKRLDKEKLQKEIEKASKEFAEYLTIWIEIRSKVTYTTGDK